MTQPVGNFRTGRLVQQSISYFVMRLAWRMKRTIIAGGILRITVKDWRTIFIIRVFTVCEESTTQHLEGLLKSTQKCATFLTTKMVFNWGFKCLLMATTLPCVCNFRCGLRGFKSRLLIWGVATRPPPTSCGRTTTNLVYLQCHPCMFRTALWHVHAVTVAWPSRCWYSLNVTP